mmetsp:Transcript_9709/g.34148  ORF Transcript_9709/g.34148 Transcript_9709/m.34148 type:complete len:120 (-) Transcript_9709:390-749(-)
MPRKGKTTKHTAKEIQAKIDAHRNMKGGAAGKAARLDPNCKWICTICKIQQPSIKSMELHYESKHAKVDWNSVKAEYESMATGRGDGKTGAERATGGAGGAGGVGTHHPPKKTKKDKKK